MYRITEYDTDGNQTRGPYDIPDAQVGDFMQAATEDGTVDKTTMRRLDTTDSDGEAMYNAWATAEQTRTNITQPAWTELNAARRNVWRSAAPVFGGYWNGVH